MIQQQVGPLQAISLFFKNYINFNGRSSRSEYWWVALACLILGLPFYWEYFPLVMHADAVTYEQLEGFAPWSMTYIVIGLALFLPSLALLCRRLHDIGKGAGWMFISCIPVIGGIWLLILLLQPSQMGPNRFGPMPNAVG